MSWHSCRSALALLNSCERGLRRMGRQCARHATPRPAWISTRWRKHRHLSQATQAQRQAASPRRSPRTSAPHLFEGVHGLHRILEGRHSVQAARCERARCSPGGPTLSSLPPRAASDAGKLLCGGAAPHKRVGGVHRVGWRGRFEGGADTFASDQRLQVAAATRSSDFVLRARAAACTRPTLPPLRREHPHRPPQAPRLRLRRCSRALHRQTGRCVMLQASRASASA